MSDAADDRTPEDRALDRAASALGELFDSVLILVTRNDDGVTSMGNRGRGNWYAQMGSAREWIAREDARARRQATRRRDDD